MGHLWIVKRGGYSEYRALCVAPTEKLAAQIAEAMNRSEESSGDPAFVERVSFIKGIASLYAYDPEH